MNDFEYVIPTDKVFLINSKLKKLSKLEIIEKDLGVDLYTFLKAVTTKIKILKDGLPFTDWCKFVYSPHGNSYLYCPISEEKVYLKDCGKTWTLVEEEFE